MAGPAPDRGDGLWESDSCEAVEQLVVALGWSAEGSGLSSDRVYDFVVCGVNQVLNEVIGALSLDAEWAQDAVGEVPKVVCDDYLGAASDDCGDDMAVGSVGEVRLL